MESTTVTPPALAASHRRPARPVRAHRPGVLMTILLVGQFMAILDAQVTNVAAPTIRHDLHASGGGLQMIITGYTIAYAMLLITGARLGDRLGHRRLFLGGLALFTIASLACGLSASSGMLIAFRLLQGTGAALMIPQVFSLIQRQFSGRERIRALSMYAAVIAAGAIAGQVVGGVLVSADLWGTGWRPVFLINVPIGAVLLLAGVRSLPRDHGEPGRGLDLPGLVVLSLAVLGLVVPLVFGHEEGWPLWGWLCLAGSAVLLAVFVAVERRAGSPLIPARVVRSPGMVVAIITIFALMNSYGGFLFTLALHLQAGLGFSPLRAGLTFVPGALCFAIASLNWRRLPGHMYRRMIPVSLLVGALSLVLLVLAVRGGDAPNALFYVSQVLFGFGFGAAYSPLLTIALSRVAPADAADASGLLTTVTQLGNVVGVAALGTLYLTQVTTSPSGHAEAWTTGAEALLTLAAGCLALFLPRSAAPAPQVTEVPARLDTVSH